MKIHRLTKVILQPMVNNDNFTIGLSEHNMRLPIIDHTSKLSDIIDEIDKENNGCHKVISESRVDLANFERM